MISIIFCVQNLKTQWQTQIKKLNFIKINSGLSKISKLNYKQIFSTIGNFQQLINILWRMLMMIIICQNTDSQQVIEMSKYKKPVEISIPQAYQLGFCTVGKVTEFPFTIFNPNAKPLNYLFKFTEFIVSPSKGVLMPNSYSSFRMEFKTSQASVTIGTVVLEIEGEQQRVFKLSAVGKYPYISANASDMDFGNVLVTKSITKDLILKNHSEVPAQFLIAKRRGGSEYNDSFFTFSPEKGSIPPKMSFAVKVNYSPNFVDCKTINNFNLVCDSGNQISLNLKGNSKRFNVYFNSNSINFGEVKLEGSSTKALTITNDSELETDFQFFTDANNIFLFNEVKGTLAKNTYKKIIIEFKPRNTIAYYQRIYCLVRNHLLLYIDLIGTCFDLLIRPVPLLQSHVDTFRKRVIEGRISAIELKYIENNILLKLAKRNIEQQKSNQNFYLSNIQIKEHPYILQKQLFLENDRNQLISINCDYLDFGFCDVMTLSGQRQIQITNKLQCKLNLNWISQKRQNLNGEYMTVFQVFPESAVLKPNTPVKFYVTFRPLKANNYYYQYLQFFATRQSSKISKKTLQQFEYRQLKAKPESTLLRNVKLTQTIQSKVRQDIQSTQVLPPFSGNVRCIGHSFNHSSLPFIPIMKILPSKVTFKPCLKNHSVYDSVELVNQSDTPIYFKFGQDVQKVFKAYPRIGLIEPKGFAIVALEFNPKEYKLYQSTISILLNDIPGSGAKLTLIGACTEPDLKIENDGKLYFAPTFAGVCTKKSFIIQNLSKTKVTYRINVPQKYQDQLSFQPLQKQLQSNEQFTLNAFFVPHQKRQYKIVVPIEAIEDTIAQNLQIGYHNPGSGTSSDRFATADQSKKIFTLEVHGQGSDGSIQISHEQINFQTVKITEQKKINVTLKNTSNCAFFVDLHFKNNCFDETYIPPTDSQIYSVFNLSFKEGTLPANSQITVGILFSPNEVFRYNLTLTVSARQKIPKNTTFKLKGNEPSMKCEMRVLAEGNYPLMQIIDIRNDTLSVAALWQNFQIQKINHELGCKLDNNQKKYLAVQTLTFSEANNLQTNLKRYDWNLGYVSTKNKAKPRKVIITVKNYGGTPLDYKFKFPSDNKVEQQLWADPGEPTEEEAYEKAILQNNIFQIKPKIGRLEPNQVKDIELIYSPASLENVKLNGSSNEIHFLKVVFQIKNGKSLVFNLKGTTLGPNEGLLTVKKIQYLLPETPIGLMQPLRFPIELNNVGSIKVNYKTQIKYEAGQFQDVFKIQNPNHFLLSGQNHYLYCLYKPLITKNYHFTVLVNVIDFNKVIQVIELQIQGQGIKAPKVSSNKNVANKPIPGQRTTVSQIGSKVFFSIEEIDFQEMQAEQIKYRMVILYNMSKDKNLVFDFPTQSNSIQKQGLTCGDKFAIEPFQGTLQPGKFIELKVTLAAGSNPSFYQGEIPCHITWASSKYATEDNDLTQKDVLMVAEKQSLFLRIKKSSNLLIKTVNNTPKLQLSDPKKSMLDHIFENIFSNALNDSQIDDILQKLQKQQTPLLDLMDTNPAINIGSSIPQTGEYQQKKDYSNYENLFLNDQFREITEIIVENTFFNIIQETTHQQNDFLRVGKKFIQTSKI